MDDDTRVTERELRLDVLGELAARERKRPQGGGIRYVLTLDRLTGTSADFGIVGQLHPGLSLTRGDWEALERPGQLYVTVQPHPAPKEAL